MNRNDVNTLMCLFMGFSYRLFTSDETEGLWAIPGRFFTHDNEQQTTTVFFYYITPSLRFDSSWDWIMPVYKKLHAYMHEKRGSLSPESYTNMDRVRNEIGEAFRNADLHQVWQSTYSGILWYINNKQ